MTTRHKLSAAFSLTEAAVVLGVVGLVIGSIWTAAGAAYDKFKSQKMAQQIGTIVQNMAQLYPQPQTIPFDATLQNKLIAAGVVPADMLVTVGGNTTITSAFGNVMSLVSGLGGERAFTIVIATPISSKACFSFYSSVSGLNPQLVSAYTYTQERAHDDYCEDVGLPIPCYIGSGQPYFSPSTPISTIRSVCDTIVREGLNAGVRIILK